MGRAPPHWCSSIQAAKARFPWKILFWLAYFTVFLAFSDSLESLKKLWLVCGVDSFWDRKRKPESFWSTYGLVESNFGISNCSKKEAVLLKVSYHSQLRVSKWITIGLNENIYLSTPLRTKTPQEISRFDLHHFAPPKALVLCNNFNSSSAAASLDVMENIRRPKKPAMLPTFLTEKPYKKKEDGKWKMTHLWKQIKQMAGTWKKWCPINTFSINFYILVSCFGLTKIRDFFMWCKATGRNTHDFSLVKCHNKATRSGLRDRIEVMAVALDIWYVLCLPRTHKKALYFEGSNIQRKVFSNQYKRVSNNTFISMTFKPFLVHVGWLMRPTLSQLSYTHRAPENQQLHAWVATFFSQTWGFWRWSSFPFPWKKPPWNL